tara:strand:- start:1127 stop:1888 length:762 start_codon:yes stop_codon:yes gene_type:complete
MAGGGIPTDAPGVAGGYLAGKQLIFPLSLVISLFFLWGFSYGLLDVLNKHFQTVLGVTRLESTGLQVMYFGGGYLCFSPIAAEVLKRKGYKVTILMGLTLYSLGAIFFWPVAHFSTPQNEKAAFGGFLACTFVIACGLATLETSANSYAVVIGHPATASARLQFCQSWNGVASFIGPLIASKAFFSGENANSLVVSSSPSSEILFHIDCVERPIRLFGRCLRRRSRRRSFLLCQTARSKGSCSTLCFDRCYRL